MSVDDLHRKTNIPTKTIYGYLKGAVENPRGNILSNLARAVGVTERELRYGQNVQNIVPLKRIPLLEMANLGALERGQDALLFWDGVSVVSVPSEDLGERAFGVRLADESGKPEFFEGDIIICDPDAPVIPGRMVFVALHDSKACVFRRYRPHNHSNGDASFTLIAPNENYPSIDVNDKTPGNVIARGVRHIRSI